MGPFEYVIVQLDGDYAHLKRIDVESDDIKLVARALLPSEIFEGCKLHYELFEYSMMR